MKRGFTYIQKLIFEKTAIILLYNLIRQFFIVSFLTSKPLFIVQIIYIYR